MFIHSYVVKTIKWIISVPVNIATASKPCITNCIVTWKNSIWLMYFSHNSNTWVIVSIITVVTPVLFLLRSQNVNKFSILDDEMSFSWSDVSFVSCQQENLICLLFKNVTTHCWIINMLCLVKCSHKNGLVRLKETLWFGLKWLLL